MIDPSAARVTTVAVETGTAAADRFQLARFALRLTFVILSGIGFAVSALLIALALALERLYAAPALPWALATLALPVAGLVGVALSTRLAKFVAGAPTISPPGTPDVP